MGRADNLVMDVEGIHNVWTKYYYEFLSKRNLLNIEALKEERRQRVPQCSSLLTLNGPITLTKVKLTL